MSSNDNSSSSSNSNSNNSNPNANQNSNTNFTNETIGPFNIQRDAAGNIRKAEGGMGQFATNDGTRFSLFSINYDSSAGHQTGCAPHGTKGYCKRCAQEARVPPGNPNVNAGFQFPNNEQDAQNRGNNQDGNVRSSTSFGIGGFKLRRDNNTGLWGTD